METLHSRFARITRPLLIFALAVCLGSTALAQEPARHPFIQPADAPPPAFFACQEFGQAEYTLGGTTWERKGTERVYLTTEDVTAPHLGIRCWRLRLYDEPALKTFAALAVPPVAYTTNSAPINPGGYSDAVNAPSIEVDFGSLPAPEPRSAVRDLVLPSVVLAGALSFDLATTREGIATRRFEEGNPLLDGSTGQREWTAAALTAAAAAVVATTVYPERPRLARWLLYSFAALHVAAGVWNYAVSH